MSNLSDSKGTKGIALDKCNYTMKSAIKGYEGQQRATKGNKGVRKHKKVQTKGDKIICNERGGTKVFY